MRQVKKQHFKGKFWNWGPVTLHMEQPEMCPICLLQKSLHPNVEHGPTGGQKIAWHCPFNNKKESESQKKTKSIYFEFYI